jgi:hypothetical protein
LTLRLDSLCDDLKTHGFGHLNQAVHNAFAAFSCLALHEASVDFHYINWVFQQPF